MDNISGGAMFVVRSCFGIWSFIASTDVFPSIDLFLTCHGRWSFVRILLFLFPLLVIFSFCSGCICIFVHFSVVLAFSIFLFLSFTARGSGSLLSYRIGSASSIVTIFLSRLDGPSRITAKYYSDVNNRTGFFAVAHIMSSRRKLSSYPGMYFILLRSGRGGEGGCFLGYICSWNPWGGRGWIPDRRCRWQQDYTTMMFGSRFLEIQSCKVREEAEENKESLDSVPILHTRVVSFSYLFIRCFSRFGFLLYSCFLTIRLPPRYPLVFHDIRLPSRYPIHRSSLTEKTKKKKKTHIPKKRPSLVFFFFLYFTTTPFYILYTTIPVNSLLSVWSLRHSSPCSFFVVFFGNQSIHSFPSLSTFSIYLPVFLLSYK